MQYFDLTDDTDVLRFSSGDKMPKIYTKTGDKGLYRDIINNILCHKN